MGRLLMAFIVFFTVNVSAETVIKATCTKDDPRYKVISKIEVHRETDPKKSFIVSDLEIDGRKIAALQKVCGPKRCPHRDGENVIEVYPHLDANGATQKVDLLLWSGASVNRVSLTDCKSK